MRCCDAEQRPCRNGDCKPLTGADVEAVDDSASLFDVAVSDMQSDVTVADGKITGTLKYLPAGNAISDVWGAGNFLCLAFDNWDDNAEQVLVGLEPSVSSGLVDVLPDPDKNGVFKVTDKNAQKFVVCVKAGMKATWQTYDLSELVCEDAGV